VSVGLIRIRVFVPFPGIEIMNILKTDSKVIVIDRDYHFGAEDGIVISELRSFLYGKLNLKCLKGMVMGIGGKEITCEEIKRVIKKMEVEVYD
ncbi:hypothetical protein NSB04_28890, partial [Blautia pseudococcoides]|nr:hypothetical protein [Blautia pseudococcoides]